MKRIIIMIVLFTVVFLHAADFALTTGRLIVGDLKGIKDDHMYIVDTTNQLHIVPFTEVESIKTNYGDVTVQWKRKKPFLDINPDSYVMHESDTDMTSPRQHSVPLQISKSRVQADIHSMTDREFQLYLAEHTAKEIRAIRYTMIGLFVLSVGGGFLLVAAQ